MQRAQRNALLTLCMLSVTLACPLPSQQSQTPILRGIREVDARVQVRWDRDIELAGGPDSATVHQNVEQTFTLELRKLGIIVAASAPNTLFCSVTTTVADRGTQIASVLTVALMEYVSLPRLASAGQFWTYTFFAMQPGLLNASNTKDEPERWGRSCAEYFGNAWLAANPPRR